MNSKKAKVTIKQAPDEIKKWNWGAFSLNWIWGIFNGVYIAFLCLIPLVNFFMMVILGIRGNEWSWKKHKWRNIDHFTKTQSRWNLWGKIFFTLQVVSVFCVLFFLIFRSFDYRANSELDVAVIKQRLADGFTTYTITAKTKIIPDIVKVDAGISGEILEMYISKGDQVKKGQKLFKINPKEYEEKLKVTISEAESLKTSLSVGKKNQELTKAQMNQIEAVTQQIKDSIKKCVVSSPIDGKINKINKNVGDLSVGSLFNLDVILEIADHSKLSAEFELEEYDRISLSEGDTLDLYVDELPNLSLYGIVKAIATTPDPSGTYKVILDIVDYKEKLVPGMSATVKKVFSMSLTPKETK